MNRRAMNRRAMNRRAMDRRALRPSTRLRRAARLPVIVALATVAVALAAGCDTFLDETWPQTLSADPAVTAEGEGAEWGPELFPKTPGDYWVYVGEGGWFHLAATDETTPLNRSTASVWRRFGPAAGWSVQRWLQLDDEAVRDYGESAAFDPCSLPRLVFPVRVGKRWQLDCGAGDFSTSAAVEAVEPIACALGTFQAVRVRYDVTRKGTSEVETWWFAPNLGVVQRRDAGGTWILRHAVVAGRE